MYDPSSTFKGDNLMLLEVVLLYKGIVHQTSVTILPQRSETKYQLISLTKLAVFVIKRLSNSRYWGHSLIGGLAAMFR